MSAPPDVFLSYAHSDRERVAPIASAVQAAGLSVWWDVDIPPGSRFRDVIASALYAASAVVVVWSRTSVGQDFVLDEASQANTRGVLVPVRIDDVRPPLGLRQLQHANLIGWVDGPHPELDKLLATLSRLAAHVVVPLEPDWSGVEHGAQLTLNAAARLRLLTRPLRRSVALLQAAPDSMAALAAAVNQVHRTYLAVLETIDTFRSASAGGGPEPFTELARGRLSTTVAARRGHCTAIGLAYWGPGGIRSALTDSSRRTGRGITRRQLDKLDSALGELSMADVDVFTAMGHIARSLASESAAIANLLLSGQQRAADLRCASDARHLASLETRLNEHHTELLTFAGELGLVVSEA